MTAFPTPFLWGAATAPHQIEGNNLNSDWWVYEQRMPHLGAAAATRSTATTASRRTCGCWRTPGSTPTASASSGRASSRCPGEFSRAELAHYRRMIDTAIGLGLTPGRDPAPLHQPALVRGRRAAWLGDTAIDRFAAYVERATEILDGVEWVVHDQRAEHARAHGPDGPGDQRRRRARVRRPDRAARRGRRRHPASDARDRPARSSPRTTRPARSLERAHRTPRSAGRSRTSRSGATPGATSEARRGAALRPRGPVPRGARAATTSSACSPTRASASTRTASCPHPPSPDNTLIGAAYRPDALGIAMRHAAEVDRRCRSSSPRTASPPPTTNAGSRTRPRRCRHLARRRSTTASTCGATCTGRCSTTSSGATGSPPSA